MPMPIMFTIFAEAGSDDLAFALAQQQPAMLGRVRYEILDNTTIYPSDAHAFKRAEYTFGPVPQADKVYIAGQNTNTVWAVRVHTTTKGTRRLMFFGLR